jgi:hypothetical protein
MQAAHVTGSTSRSIIVVAISSERTSEFQRCGLGVMASGQNDDLVGAAALNPGVSMDLLILNRAGERIGGFAVIDHKRSHIGGSRNRVLPDDFVGATETGRKLRIDCRIAFTKVRGVEARRQSEETEHKQSLHGRPKE